MDLPVLIPYTLTDKEHLFDIAQAIHAERGRIIRQGGGKIRPYTRMSQKLLWQSLAFWLLAAVQGVLIALNGPSPWRFVLLALCGFGGITALYACVSVRKSYTRVLNNFWQKTGEGGTLMVDERHIEDRSDTGNTVDFHWGEYVACVMGGDVIAILATRPLLMIARRTPETESHLRAALCALGRENTIFEVAVRE